MLKHHCWRGENLRRNSPPCQNWIALCRGAVLILAKYGKEIVYRIIHDMYNEYGEGDFGKTLHGDFT